MALACENDASRSSSCLQLSGVWSEYHTWSECCCRCTRYLAHANAATAVVLLVFIVFSLVLVLVGVLGAVLFLVLVRGDDDDTT